MTDDTPEELQGILGRFSPGWPELLEISEGWHSLLARLDERLAAIAPIYVVQQVKSKFGALCFYAQPSDDPLDYNEEFNQAIRAAEWESVETCELCGQSARQYVIRMRVWTLCDAHV